MAAAPRHIDVLTPVGVTRVPVTYTHRFRQIVRVRFCWLYEAGITHNCEEMGCWEAQR